MCDLLSLYSLWLHKRKDVPETSGWVTNFKLTSLSKSLRLSDVSCQLALVLVPCKSDSIHQLVRKEEGLKFQSISDVNKKETTTIGTGTCRTKLVTIQLSTKRTMISLSGLKCGFKSLGNSPRLLQSLSRTAEGGDKNNAVVLLAGITSCRDISNSHRASITRINRIQYVLHYPTTVVNPDGSTFTVRYTTPRKIIKLPVDVTQLSESDRYKRLERRKVKTKVKLEDEFEGESFDTQKYIKFIKKWKKMKPNGYFFYAYKSYAAAKM